MLGTPDSKLRRKPNSKIRMGNYNILFHQEVRQRTACANFAHYTKHKCDDPHVWWFAGGANVSQAKVWLFVEGADVASTQQKKLAALGYSASPQRKLWLREGED
ncbi:hypothetical protein DSO57_1006998 [Entomophthora muscae]|uniref:Uncharacterized protein n=1 Tax=Entomophthora muscae TaxID=34485 RepID=A0ACC2USS3_9FUNG|nr:hypothetical protein DSO57_1006998 [Entomophthora muscae]